ncbi:MAG: RsmD family RNA methyltransferase, partial [Bdellovibrionales bacterium]|nr:RsmD family RNA methyltransferase [Bdellovibrionales bacterium]
MRIISGELGGRRISVPEAPHRRPTTDRVREALFSVLQSQGALSAKQV